MAEDHDWIPVSHGWVEVWLALGGLLPADRVGEARDAFVRDRRCVLVVELDARVCRTAGSIGDSVGLRTLAALHLAAPTGSAPDRSRSSRSTSDSRATRLRWASASSGPERLPLRVSGLGCSPGPRPWRDPGRGGRGRRCRAVARMRPSGRSRSPEHPRGTSRRLGRGFHARRRLGPRVPSPRHRTHGGQEAVRDP